MMDSKVADEASGIILALSEDTKLPHGIKFHLEDENLAEWLEGKGIGHVRGAPYNPQTQGKIE